ncbi:ABC transporter ATP-binding protein [Hydrogenophaga laconesensis]|uniref:ABC-type nitrate/sulfonate/bicarbonate transport system ATPase subunit n=1 Tax=Hydrogenophaga laconesensis TaxID=1805971 RepID=A0ABU1V7V9_9BURK|nr:ABC transporter ATP-binding protein [Hydrogenophaga laconesensis]MDR7093536.1 ABC-type nitrate/sulfonate/bicarbonate transport system ATPase subunit [Hydrogenophaga laconesensis]
MAQIQVSTVSKTFSSASNAPRRVLDGVSFSIGEGEVVGLLGPSGCGKSTLLNIVAGLDEAHTGSVTVQGRPMREQLGAGFRVSYVFQESRLLPWYTLQQNLEFVLQAGEFPRSEWAGRIERVLSAVDLTGFRDFYPAQLSGGMQQRASIARAFCIDPDILLMDEPFSALDELTARKLRQSLLDLWEKFRTTIVFVSHNAFESTFLADRILVMGHGKITHEIDLSGSPRPRCYDDTALFETSKRVIRTLEQHSVSPPSLQPHP